MTKFKIPKGMPTVYIPESGFGPMCTNMHDAMELTRQGVRAALKEAGIETGGLMTRDEVYKWLETPGGVARAVEVIYDRQESDEKREGETKHRNGVGFNGTDARFGSDLAERIRRARTRGVKYKNCLTSGQLIAAKKMIKKYWKQLAEEAERKKAHA